jgi:protein SCO1
MNLAAFNPPAHAEKIPQELQDVGIDEHLGSQVDPKLSFVDDTGKPVQLGQYFGTTKPVLFFLVYYECPNLCTFVLNAAVDAMKDLPWNAGQKYEVVAVSVDPREKPELAARKKQAYISELGKGKAGFSAAMVSNGWHFLTGEQPQITALAKQLGFKYKWDAGQKEFAHASAMFVLTPEGRISRYFYGIEYPSRDVKVALLEASHGKIGSVLDKVLLFCYHYDASTKKYVLLANRIMTMGGAVTVFVLGAFFIGAYRKEQRAQLNIIKG